MCGQKYQIWRNTNFHSVNGWVIRASVAYVIQISLAYNISKIVTQCISDMDKCNTLLWLCINRSCKDPHTHILYFIKQVVSE